MKGAKEFKERMRSDEEFKKKFENARGQDEVIKIAKENGYDLTNCSEEEEAELTEDMLEGVAGGKTKKTSTQTVEHAHQELYATDGSTISGGGNITING